MVERQFVFLFSERCSLSLLCYLCETFGMVERQFVFLFSERCGLSLLCYLCETFDVSLRIIMSKTTTASLPRRNRHGGLVVKASAS